MDDRLMQFGGQFAVPPSSFQRYHVYSFHHLDDLAFMKLCSEAFSSFPDAQNYLDSIRSLFRGHGWEGDGRIQLFWLPPFVVNSHDTDGIYCFHVKQNNNGTSWIASPVPLRFKGLNYLTEEIYP
ncbi:MAG TPA: hypothetical protein PLN02_07335 [Azonexus sp.]|nr:hypothetical protein [Azonexus sp.]